MDTQSPEASAVASTLEKAVDEAIAEKPRKQVFSLVVGYAEGISPERKSEIEQSYVKAQALDAARLTEEDIPSEILTMTLYRISATHEG